MVYIGRGEDRLGIDSQQPLKIPLFLYGYFLHSWRSCLVRVILLVNGQTASTFNCVVQQEGALLDSGY